MKVTSAWRTGERTLWLLLTLWLSLMTGSVWAQFAKPGTLVLSMEDKAWIAAHPTVRIAFDGNFPPHSFVDDSGQLVGMAVDTVQLIRERTGLQFEVDKRTTWMDLYQAAEQREVDVVATMVKRPERRELFTFTRPYIFKSLVIMTRDDDARIGRREDIAGKTVALVKNYSYVSRVLAEFPTVQPYYVDTMLDGLNAVVTGKADAAITFVGAGHYLQEKYLLSNLRFAAIYDPDSANEGFGVRADWPRLAIILDKALASISQSEKEAIAAKWVPSLARPTDWALIGGISAGFLLLLALAALWLRYLHRQKLQLSRANKKAHQANEALTALKSNLEQEVVQRTAALVQSQKALQNHRDHLELEVQQRTVELTERSQEGETLNRAMLAMLEDLQEATARSEKASLDLASANAHLLELDRLKSVFIASMSHELRTPLNSIIGFTGMIVDDMTGPISAQQRSYLQRVHRAAHHLLGLITDIIDVSKIDAGKLAADYSDFDLLDVLHQAHEQVEPMAQGKGLALTLAIPSGITLHSERKRLLQCVLNLLSNAIKYTEKGGVSLSAQVHDGRLKVCVTDTGIGMSQADLARLYQPFTRFESPLKITAGGSGLGLYLTRKLAQEVLGGDLMAQSTVGTGSTFCLCVPLRVDATALRHPASEPLKAST